MKQSKSFIYKIAVFGIMFSFAACSNNSENSLNTISTRVEVARVEIAGDDHAIVYSGTIEESESIPLSFSNIGTVARVFVSEGDFVKSGQLLATLNEESYKNSYEMSLATLKQVEDAYNRLQPMYKNGNLPEIKYVEAETRLQQAKAAAAIAKKSLDDCKLFSPVNGFVGKRSVEPGMSAMPNVTSIKIVKIEKVFARVSVPENEISLIKKGQKSKIKIAALNSAEFIGTVEEIGVLADQIAHTYQIKIGIANNKYEIKPGMICNVLISNSSSQNNLIVPSQAVQVDEKGKNYVYAVSSQNKAVRKFVTIGKLLNNGIEITGGLNSGEKIVVVGQQKLIDNAFVKIVNE